MTVYRAHCGALNVGHTELQSWARNGSEPRRSPRHITITRDESNMATQGFHERKAGTCYYQEPAEYVVTE